jgi:pyruvate kinase
VETARRTKLVCTIGPASAGRVGDLVAAGMDVARINFSHGTPEEHTAAAHSIRAASAQYERPVAIVTDLAGPKIRLGKLAAGEVRLTAGQPFSLRSSTREPGDEHGAWVTFRGLAGDVRAGDRILLADGAAELRVTGERGGDVITEVAAGGLVRSGAGVAVPADRLSAPPLTARDRADIPRLLELGADYVAQSFVRRAADVVQLRKRLGPDGPPIIAKIETRPAVDRFDDILDVADAVMIARGDLGVELPYEEVPLVQKQLLRRALDRGVPSIVATQMLESMTGSPRPTRAEASDVANAVFDGADAIMLSGETAIGEYPVLAAEAAQRIARLSDQRGRERLPVGGPPPVDSDAGALAYAAVALAATGAGIDAIACYTRTGRTARLLSALRPGVPVFAFSPDPAVARRLALVHGVMPGTCPRPDDAGGRLRLIADVLGRSNLLPAGSAVVLVASTAAPGSGPNLLEIHRIPDRP